MSTSVASSKPSSEPVATHPFFSASLPRTAGYGLFALFFLDLVQLAASYQPFVARMDAQMSMQVLERSGVLVVAYVLVFLDTKRVPSRFSRAAMKALSWLTLVAAFAYVALAGNAVLSAVRIYRENEAVSQSEWSTRKALIAKVESSLPTLSNRQASAILGEFMPASRSKILSMSDEEVFATLKTELPAQRAAADSHFSRTHRGHLRDQTVFAAKYGIAGLMMAVIMLLVFENTRVARMQVVFEGAARYPKLRVEGYVARKAYRTWLTMERLGDFLLPDFTSFAWYRRLKRRFKKRG